MGSTALYTHERRTAERELPAARPKESAMHAALLRARWRSGEASSLMTNRLLKNEENEDPPPPTAPPPPSLQVPSTRKFYVLRTGYQLVRRN